MSREKTEKIVTEYIVTCDICNKISRYTTKCPACEKDVCSICSVYDDSEPGDYNDSFCRRCWDIGTSFRDKISNEVITPLNKFRGF